MHLSRDRTGASITPDGAVVAIGAFDGVHLGHQALLRRIRGRATELGTPTVVVSFEPLPRQYFAREPLLRLTPFRERFERLRECGVDYLLCLRFDARLTVVEAGDFVREVLVNRLRAREVWVGPDFRFGHARSGDIASLRTLGVRFGFAAHEIPVCNLPLSQGQTRISASHIRTALCASNFAGAAAALGRRYSYSGRVVRGQQLGRKLGFPTANLRWPQDSLGFSGIFAVRVSGAGLHQHAGVASLGYRPAVGGKELLLEVHLFDFDGDLYARRLSIDFIAKQRDERHFPDLDSLVLQIGRDAVEARLLLGENCA